MTADGCTAGIGDNCVAVATLIELAAISRASGGRREAPCCSRRRSARRGSATCGGIRAVLDANRRAAVIALEGTASTRS